MSEIIGSRVVTATCLRKTDNTHPRFSCQVVWIQIEDNPKVCRPDFDVIRHLPNHNRNRGWLDLSRHHNENKPASEFYGQICGSTCDYYSLIPPIKVRNGGIITEYLHMRFSGNAAYLEE